MSGLPQEMFTGDNRPAPDSVYEELAVEFPQHVRKNADGFWEVDVWAAPGRFSPAIKALHARTRPAVAAAR